MSTQYKHKLQYRQSRGLYLQIMDYTQRWTKFRIYLERKRGMPAFFFFNVCWQNFELTTFLYETKIFLLTLSSGIKYFNWSSAEQLHCWLLITDMISRFGGIYFNTPVGLFNYNSSLHKHYISGEWCPCSLSQLGLFYHLLWCTGVRYFYLETLSMLRRKSILSCERRKPSFGDETSRSPGVIASQTAVSWTNAQSGNAV